MISFRHAQKRGAATSPPSAGCLCCSARPNTPHVAYTPKPRPSLSLLIASPMNASVQFAVVLAIAVASFPVEALCADDPPHGWKLVWSDEFDGTEIDRTKWDRDVGNGFYNYGANVWISGWGND